MFYISIIFHLSQDCSTSSTRLQSNKVHVSDVWYLLSHHHHQSPHPWPDILLEAVHFVIAGRMPVNAQVYELQILCVGAPSVTCDWAYICRYWLDQARLCKSQSNCITGSAVPREIIELDHSDTCVCLISTDKIVFKQLIFTWSHLDMNQTGRVNHLSKEWVFPVS